MSVCHQMSKSLSDAMERELDDVQTEALLRHLEACDGCRRFRDQLITIRLGMRKIFHGNQRVDSLASGCPDERSGPSKDGNRL